MTAIYFGKTLKLLMNYFDLKERELSPVILFAVKKKK